MCIYIFFLYCRIHRTTYDILLEHLRPTLEEEHVRWKQNFGLEKQLLMFLWYLANKESYRVVARLFHVSKSTAHKYIHRVSEAVSNLSEKLIKWPDFDVQQDISDTIQNTSYIPNCVGFIDGSHIRLQSAPNGDRDYTNRKGYFSIQLQMICDDKCIITDTCVGWQGCTHDARVFRNSQMYDGIENGNALAQRMHWPSDSSTMLYLQPDRQ